MYYPLFSKDLDPTQKKCKTRILVWQGQKAQGLLNTFKQSDPSDLPAVIFKIS